VRNLVEVEPLRDGLAGATEADNADVKGKLVEYAWWMRKEGYDDVTIKCRSYLLRRLAREGADILDPESVRETLALQKWPDNYKITFITAYASFCKMRGIEWHKPKCRFTPKIPFIPTEEEINNLIAGCGKKPATFLQTLKETAMRSGEATRLRWTDIDSNNNTVTVNSPEKGGNPRIIKVSPRLIAMLHNMPRTSDYVFGRTSSDSMRRNISNQRKAIARKLKNPRISQIHPHTLRHWKATTEYHRTKDILHVKQMLGHKNINNTMLYTQLVNFESDNYTTRVSNCVREDRELIEAGFEFVTERNGVKIYRKPE